MRTVIKEALFLRLTYIVVALEVEIDGGIEPVRALLARLQPRDALVPVVVTHEHLQRADVMAVHVTHEAHAGRAGEVRARRRQADVQSEQKDTVKLNMHVRIRLCIA